MEPQSVERRLAAILAADVVGYGRLMGQDEAGTLGALEAHCKELINPKIAEHRGRVVRLTGDGTLAEFASVVDAVTCAVEIQRAMAERNADIPEDRRIVLRVGINLGDIIIANDDIHGDGVNLAVRLEGIARAGGVAISQPVLDQIQDKLKIAFEDAGEHRLKNIARPVHVWHWAASAPALHEGPTDKGSPLPLPDKPSIAVLPFDNISGDPEQAYFSDGITEDIITALCHFSWFFVIARNSSFTFKGKVVPVRQVGRDLGVRYVLQGSVRKAGKRLRVTAQLIDARADRHLWAERYDRDLEDMFAIQDEITASVAHEVAPQLLSAEIKRARRRTLPHLDTWGRVMRAHERLAYYKKEANAKARNLLEEAIQHDRNSSLAYADLAFTHCMDATFAWTENIEAAFAAAVEAARSAIANNPRDPWARCMFAWTRLFGMPEHEVAIRELEGALETNPNLAFGHILLGWILALAGQGRRGDRHAELAIRHSPRDPFVSMFWAARGFTAFAVGAYDKVVEFGHRSIQQEPPFIGGYRILAAGLAQTGRIEEAREVAAEFMKRAPGMTLRVVRKQQPWKREQDMAAFIGALRKAGLPE